MKIRKTIYVLIVGLFLSFSCYPQRDVKQYQQLKKELASGWNTWNTRSVLSHVLLPQAFAINLEVQDGKSKKYYESL